MHGSRPIGDGSRLFLELRDGHIAVRSVDGERDASGVDFAMHVMA
jgi:hypothetical protein